MKNWLRIIRPVNLLILAITMYGIDACILQPNFTTYGIQFSMNEIHFFLLVLATVMICAGGYILNDYFDVQIDAVNKPAKVLIGQGIQPNTAFYVYMALSFVGLSIGTYVSIAIDYWKLVTVFVMAIALLYFYSAGFKRTPLVGNIMVAILSALSVLIIFIFEPHLYDLARPGDYYIAGLCTRFILTLSVTAFATTMVREIVKDIEDMEGDDQYGARTLPIAWGVTTAKVIAVVFIFVTLAALGYLFTNVLEPKGIAYLGYLIIVILANIITAGWLFVAKTQQQYHALSTWIKISMLVGLLILPIYLLTAF